MPREDHVRAHRLVDAYLKVIGRENAPGWGRAEEQLRDSIARAIAQAYARGRREHRNEIRQRTMRPGRK